MTDQDFVAGYPTAEATARLLDELDYQRAVQDYIWAVPLVNFMARTRGVVRAGISLTEPGLLVFDQPISAKQGLLTANAEVVYGLSRWT
jgi:hypothetical protein